MILTNPRIISNTILFMGGSGDFDLTLDWMKRNKTNQSTEDLITIVEKYLNELVVEYLDNPDL